MTDYKAIFAALQRLAKAGDGAGATALITGYLDAAPDDVILHRMAAHLAVAQYQGQQAIHHFSRLTEAGAANQEDFFAIGKTYLHLGHPVPALQAFQQCLNLSPKHGAAWRETGKCLMADTLYDPAIDAFRHALELAPDDAETLMQLGNALLMCTDPEGSMAVLDKAVSLRPDIAVLRSAALICAQYQPGMTAQKLQQLHRDATPAFASAAPNKLPARRLDGRNLRIGFLSGNFRRHPIGFFLAPWLQHADRLDADIHVFSITPAASQDTQTDRLRQCPVTWHDLSEISISDLEARILDTRLDVLVDSGGHRAGNRLPLLAKRLAPLQVTWMESVGTTGVPNIDAIIADPHHFPAGEDQYYDETILHMPRIKAVIDFPYAPDTPLSTTLPQEKQGHVTFGSISQPAKFNRALAGCWSQILHQVPGAKLLLKYGGLDQQRAIGNLHAMFTVHDIAPDRLIIEGKSPHKEALACYDQRIDIALDPFPYSGGITTLEAAWMGCPIITMPGQTVAGRHSTAYLRNMGLEDLIATSETDYINKAVSLATDTEMLRALRARMRPALQQSPMMQPAAYAQDLVRLLRKAFEQKVATAV